MVFLNAFLKIVNKSNRKPNKLWIDQRRDFSDKLMQEWLKNKYILCNPRIVKVTQ